MKTQMSVDKIVIDFLLLVFKLYFQDTRGKLSFCSRLGTLARLFRLYRNVSRSRPNEQTRTITWNGKTDSEISYNRSFADSTYFYLKS